MQIYERNLHIFLEKELCGVTGKYKKSKNY